MGWSLASGANGVAVAEACLFLGLPRTIMAFGGAEWSPNCNANLL